MDLKLRRAKVLSAVSAVSAVSTAQAAHTAHGRQAEAQVSGAECQGRDAPDAAEAGSGWIAAPWGPRNGSNVVLLTNAGVAAILGIPAC